MIVLNRKLYGSHNQPRSLVQESPIKQSRIIYHSKTEEQVVRKFSRTA